MVYDNKKFFDVEKKIVMCLWLYPPCTFNFTNQTEIALNSISQSWTNTPKKGSSSN